LFKSSFELNAILKSSLEILSSTKSTKHDNSKSPSLSALSNKIYDIDN